MMKLFHTVIYLVPALVIFSSCVNIEPLNFTGIEDIKILSANTNNIVLTANLVFYNPNVFAVELESANLVMLVEDSEVASLQQTYSSQMPAKAAFKIPFHINMDMATIHGGSLMAGLGRGIQLFSDNKVQARIKGTIGIRKGVATITVPIDRSEWIKVRK